MPGSPQERTLHQNDEAWLSWMTVDHDLGNAPDDLTRRPGVRIAWLTTWRASETTDRSPSFEGDVVAIDYVDFQLNAVESILDARSLHSRARSGGGKPLLSQVHRDPIDIDGYVLFGSQPLSWGAVVAYALSPEP